MAGKSPPPAGIPPAEEYFSIPRPGRGTAKPGGAIYDLHKFFYKNVDFWCFECIICIKFCAKAKF